MIVGFGLDVVEVARIGRQLASPTAGRFLRRVFTQGEQEFCGRVRDRATRLAARFAAKEAAIKALGAPPGVSLHDIEVVRGEGAPRLLLSGRASIAADALGVVRSHLTLTHDGGIAAAAVIFEATP